MAAIPIVAGPFGSRAFVGTGSELSLRLSPSVSIFFGSVPILTSSESVRPSLSMSGFLGSKPCATSAPSSIPSSSVSAFVGSVVKVSISFLSFRPSPSEIVIVEVM